MCNKLQTSKTRGQSYVKEADCMHREAESPSETHSALQRMRMQLISHCICYIYTMSCTIRKGMVELEHGICKNRVFCSATGPCAANSPIKSPALGNLHIQRFLDWPSCTYALFVEKVPNGGPCTEYAARHLSIIVRNACPGFVGSTHRGMGQAPSPLTDDYDCSQICN